MGFLVVVFFFPMANGVFLVVSQHFPRKDFGPEEWQPQVG